MKKWSLILWFAAIVGAALISTGCESPTDSSAGAPGADGAVTLSGPTVNAADLAAVFKVTDRILLMPGVTSVEGKIPAGKTLSVSGATAVDDGTTNTTTFMLEVAGTLEIQEGATLNANGVTVSGNTVGYLIGTGAVIGDGVLALPYLNGELPEGYPSIITYASGNVSAAGKYAASYSTGEAPPEAITEDNATTILALDGVSTLTLSGIAAVEDITIPANKTLTLIGAGNTITAALDLSEETTGSLVVANGASLAVSGGALKGSITNSGTITTSDTTAANVVSYITVPTGAGTVKLSGAVAGAIDTATLALTQNVEIASVGKLVAPNVATPFSGGKTITVASGGTLDLGATVTTLTGATIVNRGTVSTATTSVATLNTFLALTGNITATAAVTGTATITVPATTKLSIAENASLTLNDGSVVTGTIEVASDGTITTPANPGSALSGSGKIVLNQGAKGNYGTSGFIGPVPGSGTPYEFTWDASASNSKVTLTIDSLTVNSGAITAAKDTGVAAGTKIVIATVSTASAGNPHAKLTVASGVTFAVAGTLEVLGEGGLVTTGATLTIAEGGQVIENVSEEYGLSTVDNSVAANNVVLGSPTVLKATAKKVRTASTTASPTVTIKVEKTPNQTLKWVSDFKDETSKDIWGAKTAGTTTVSGNWTDIAIKLTSVFSPLGTNKVSVRQTNQAFRYYSNDTLLASKPTAAVFTAGDPNIWIPAASDPDNLPVKWKGYNDASSLVKATGTTGTTWGIILWDKDETEAPQITLDIYDESGTDTTKPIITKIEIDYSDLLP